MQYICKPYKTVKRNSIDVVLFALTILIYTATLTYINIPYMEPNPSDTLSRLQHFILNVLVCLLPLYGMCLMVYQIGNFIKVILPHRLISFMKREELFVRSFSSLIDHGDERSPLINA